MAYGYHLRRLHAPAAWVVNELRALLSVRPFPYARMIKPPNNVVFPYARMIKPPNNVVTEFVEAGDAYCAALVLARPALETFVKTPAPSRVQSLEMIAAEQETSGAHQRWDAAFRAIEKIPRGLLPGAVWETMSKVKNAAGTFLVVPPTTLHN